MICDFLVDQYQSGLSVSSLNSMRSSLSFFCPKELNLGDNPIILRVFKSFYRLRPAQPKYLVYWPVEKVLDLLSSWHPASTLDLKHLTLKTLALIALSASDRGQTIHALNIENTHVDKEAISFVIFDTLKTTKRKRKPKIVKCIATPNPALNVCNYVLSYMNRTLAIRAAHVSRGRPKPTQLFLSWKTKGPVTKRTLSRWLTTVLGMATIDTSQFQAHSYRGAGLSAAFERGATLQQIVAAGDWTNSNTFATFYNAPASNSAVGNIIMRNCKVCFVTFAI